MWPIILKQQAASNSKEVKKPKLKLGDAGYRYRDPITKRFVKKPNETRKTEPAAKSKKNKDEPQVLHYYFIFIFVALWFQWLILLFVILYTIVENEKLFFFNYDVTTAKDKLQVLHYNFNSYFIVSFYIIMLCITMY